MSEKSLNRPVETNSAEPFLSSRDYFLRWGKTRLRILFLLPMAIAIGIIVFVLTLTLYQQSKGDVQEGVIRVRTSAYDFYEESIRYDTNALKAIMHTLIKDKDLSGALARRDRQALLRLATPLFKDLKHDFQITHFYFTGTDRVNLVQVHAPLRYGDTIERLTTLQAEKSGSIAYGVELGPLGTFTLRLVAPWFDQKTRKLIGYVELGMEIDHVINKLQSFFGVQAVTVINKTFLNRKKWESGMRTLGRTPRWDHFSDVVASEHSFHSIPSLLLEQLTSGQIKGGNTILKLSHKGVSYRVTTLPLEDAGGRGVAQMILIADVSRDEEVARKTVAMSSGVALVVGAVLFVFFYWLVGLIGHRIEINEKKLQKLATHDGLTGLYNQRFFYCALEDELARAKRYDHCFSLLLLDLDFFKKVNDTYGHRSGDAVLGELGRRLKSRMRSSDVICRYGGEEISVILPETDTAAATLLGEDLRRLIEEKLFDVDNGQAITITVSIGIATFPRHVEEMALLVSHADTALYQAKKEGRNCVRVYQPQDV
jgi:diguanylate cyclase (GGDEF)-like protein